MSRSAPVKSLRGMRECSCGYMCRKILLPDDLRELSGWHHIWVHDESGDTRCYPDSTNPDDAKATVFSP